MQRDSLLLTEMIDAFRSHITQSEGAVWAHSTLTTRITPSMNCGQRGQMHHDLCAYLPVRAAMGGAFFRAIAGRWAPLFVIGRTVAVGPAQLKGRARGR
jgi:hypothetical protein